MKYTVQILTGDGAAHQAFELDATGDHEAVNAARLAHEVTEEGGDFNVVVSCADTHPSVRQWVPGAPGDDPETRLKGKFVDAPRPPCEVSRFSVSHEAAEHLRPALEAKRAQDELLRKREALKAEVRAEVLAEIEAAKAVSK